MPSSPKAMSAGLDDVIAPARHDQVIGIAVVQDVHPVGLRCIRAGDALRKCQDIDRGLAAAPASLVVVRDCGKCCELLGCGHISLYHSVSHGFCAV